MAISAGDAAAVSFWGSAAVLFALFCNWLSRKATKAWKAQDAKEDAERADKAAQRLAAQQFAAQAAVVALPPEPSRANTGGHEAAELAAVRIQLSRALLELDERDSALRRVRAEAEEDLRRVRAEAEESLRRQRIAIDQLESENRARAAAITEGRGREEAMREKLDTIERQIAAGNHVRPADTRTNANDPDRSARNDRGFLRPTGSRIDPARAPRPETPFGNNRNKGQ